jgi:hypothetical protein
MESFSFLSRLMSQEGERNYSVRISKRWSDSYSFPTAGAIASKTSTDAQGWHRPMEVSVDSPTPHQSCSLTTSFKGVCAARIVLLF